MERSSSGGHIGSMVIVIPFALLGALILSSRGRPWAALVLSTLGLFVGQALLALTAHGTLGLERVVVQPGWWIPTAVFGALALATGIRGLRRTLFQGSALKALKSPVPLGQGELPRANWAKAFEGAAGWSGATGSIVRGRSLTSAELHSNPEPLMRGVRGHLGQLTETLDKSLSAVTDSDLESSGRLPESLHRLSEQLDAAWDADAHAVTLNERSEIIARGASRAFEVGRVLSAEPRRTLARLEADLGRGLTEAAGEFSTDPNELFALGWTGAGQAQAVVARESRGKEPVLGLRVSWNIDGMVAADAATSIVLDAITFDPEGLLTGGNGSTTDTEPMEPPVPIGRTCVVVPHPSQQSKKKRTKKWTQAARAKVLASHPCSGTSKGDSVFVALEDLPGGARALGQGGLALDAVIADYQGRCVTAVHAGIGQRALATRGAEAVIRNVMFGDTIEAWGHALGGAGLLKLRALSTTGAVISEERGLTATEGRTLDRASRRALAEWLSEFERVEVTRLRSSGALVRETALADSYLAALMGTTPDAGADAPAAPDSIALPSVLTWVHDCRQAASAVEFDHAWCAGQRGAWTATSRAVVAACSRAIPKSLMPESLASADPLERQADAVLRAHFVTQCAATSGLITLPAAAPSLGAAEEHLTVAATVAAAHRLGDSQPVDKDLVEFAILTELQQAWIHVRAGLRALRRTPRGSLARTRARIALWASRSVSQGPSAGLSERVAAALIAQPELLRRLTSQVFEGDSGAVPLSELKAVAGLASATRVPIAAIRRAQAVGQLPPGEFADVLDLAVEHRIVSLVDVTKIRACMAGTGQLWVEPLDNGVDAESVRGLSDAQRQSA